ncbi:MAG: ATP-binding protein [Thiogranum sp.]
MLKTRDFRRRFLSLILLAWILPPVVGLGFIMFIRILTPEQVLAIMLAPTEPLYITVWLAFAIWYFPRCMRPLYDWLERQDPQTVPHALQRMRRFPLHFWGAFLVYLTLAPGSVLISAELHTDFVAQPVDWFRIHLVALIVSIIVGLPIFFKILDLFGQSLGNIALTRPHVTIKTKVFLVGALIPLLIDTMLVQYYWTRTGFFTTETFFVWLALELLAIAGSLIFVHSIGQSMAPLRNMIEHGAGSTNIDETDLLPMSTDELGVLTTDYRHLLHELHRNQEELEQRVAERTRELTSANTELESFSYSVSHDLRAPLRSIDGYSRALLEDYHDQLDEAGKNFLDRISHNAIHMAELIDDLLDLARIGRSEMKYEQINPGQVAGEIMQTLREAYLEDREVIFNNRVNTTIQADKRLLKVALGNLLNNAWKYTGNEPVTEITFGTRTDAGETVYFVRDNGVGFDMAYADKLFGAFQRLHGHDEFEGTGIGLATVARIIQRHGGRIWAEAEIGTGSTFYFTLGEAQAHPRGDSQEAPARAV